MQVIKPATEQISLKRSEFLLLTIATSLCVLVVLDANMVALSLPSISRSYRTAFDQLEWVISAYMITFAACLLPAGGLADQYGRRTLLLWGLLIFSVASVLCGLAWSPLALNIARAVQGVGAAMQLTSALAIIGNAFTDSKLAAKAWGIWGTCIGITTCVAPIVGGVFTYLFGWRSIFLVNAPLGVLIAYLVRKHVPDSRSNVSHPVDAVGSLLFACALGLLIWALISAGSVGWTAGPTVAKLCAALALLIVFIAVELRRPHAMVDLSLFRNGLFTAGVIGMFGFAAAGQVLLTLFPLYMQTWFGFLPLTAGAAMLPFAIAMAIGPTVGGRIGRGKKPQFLLCVGLVVVSVGNMTAAHFATSHRYWHIAIAMAVIGLGVGILNGTTQRAIMSEAPVQRSGMVSGIAQTTRFSSIVMAVGVLGAVMAQRTHAIFDATFRPAILDERLLHIFVDKVLSGDAEHTIGLLPSSLRASAIEAARAANAEGFADALLVTAGISAFSFIAIALLTNFSRSRR
ncbi:MFS transporter [Paraburkholderia sp. BCC1885]|uniref:MFS transporter n=1 Tax=Paraburkholderia sp. BCC1885 TaxID=2562669 RepID=UPI0011825005|nr:MFS transporter [Paraburkholderia sp. BCC1885]